MELNIAHLYPELLNIYGDRGNIICLKQRCLARSIKVKVYNVSLNNQIKSNDYDLFFGGGGQDRQQVIVANDLQKKANILKLEADRGIPMLAICGTYQLFGHYFKTQEKTKIPGISIFDSYTIASNQRKIGNIVVKLLPLINNPASSAGRQLAINQQPRLIGGQAINNQIVGFENHSGNTFITKPEFQKNTDKTTYLADVIMGYGNNGLDKTEGARYKNVFGTYLHGPILPKNPHFSDMLIKIALEIKYQKKFSLQALDDNLEWQAHKASIKRAYQSG